MLNKWITVVDIKSGYINEDFDCYIIVYFNRIAIFMKKYTEAKYKAQWILKLREQIKKMLTKGIDPYARPELDSETE